MRADGSPVGIVAKRGYCEEDQLLEFTKVTVQYGEPMCWEAVEQPTREQQQEVAEQIFCEVKALHAGLTAHGRRTIVQRVHAQRREKRRARRRAATA